MLLHHTANKIWILDDVTEDKENPLFAFWRAGWEKHICCCLGNGDDAFCPAMLRRWTHCPAVPYDKPFILIQLWFFQCLEAECEGGCIWILI